MQLRCLQCFSCRYRLPSSAVLTSISRRCPFRHFQDFGDYLALGMQEFRQACSPENSNSWHRWVTSKLLKHASYTEPPQSFTNHNQVRVLDPGFLKRYKLIRDCGTCIRTETPLQSRHNLLIKVNSNQFRHCVSYCSKRG